MKTNKERAILILSHGSLAPSLLESAKMICGDIKKATALSLYEGANIEEYGRKIRAKIEEFGGSPIILVDLFGGTPFNQLVAKCFDLDFCAVTGVSLPMLLEATASREMSSDQDLIDRLMEAGSSGVYDINKFINDTKSAETSGTNESLGDLERL